MTLDLANTLYNFVMVPLYDSLGPESISYVINHSEITTCFCDKNSIITLLKTKDLGKLEFIIGFDSISEEEITQIKNRNLKFMSWN